MRDESQNTESKEAQATLFDLQSVQGYSILKPKQLTFVKAMLAGKTKREAAIEAGYDENSAGQSAHKLAKNGTVLAFLNQAFAKAGATPELPISRMAQRAAELHAKLESLPVGGKEYRKIWRMAHAEDTALLMAAGKFGITINQNMSTRLDAHITVTTEQREKLESVLRNYRQSKLQEVPNAN